MSSSPYSPTTIIGCFDQNLPSLDPTSKNEHKTVSPSGATTARAIPPRILFCDSPKELESIADHVLRDSKVKNKHSTAGQTPSNFTQWSKNSEQDICQASSVYIFAQISEILNILYPTGWKMHTECTSARLNQNQAGDEEEQGELDEIQSNKSSKKRKVAKDKGKAKDKGTVQGQENLRFDLIFQRDPGEDTIAIVEYKKPAQIRYQDFSKALVSTKDKVKTVQDDRTKLAGNAISYSKQVCAYASNRTCPHIALFNWDHLLIFNFYDLAAQRRTEDLTAGDEAGLVWVSEDPGLHEEHIHHAHIRKVLLGWLVKAFGKHFPQV